MDCPALSILFADSGPGMIVMSAARDNSTAAAEAGAPWVSNDFIEVLSDDDIDSGTINVMLARCKPGVTRSRLLDAHTGEDAAVIHSVEEVGND